MTPFLPLVKADQASRTIWARAAVEEPDKSREIMDYASAVPQFQAWSDGFKTATLGKSLGNIRAMHNPRHLAGKVTEIVFDDAAKAVDICLKVIDPVDWAKVEEGGYTGLSIGGGYLKKWQDGELTRYTPRIAEISLVDSPCIPSALLKLEMQKRDGSVEEILLKGSPRTFAQMRPPASFNERMQKGILGRVNEFTDALAAHPSVTQMLNHPGVKLAGKAVKGGKVAREAVATVGGVAGLASGAYEVKHHRAEAALKKPRYMQKSVSDVIRAGLRPAAQAAETVGGHVANAGGKVGGFVGGHIGRAAGNAGLGREIGRDIGRQIPKDFGAEAVSAASLYGAYRGGKAVYNRVTGTTKKPAAEMKAPGYMQKSEDLLAAIAKRDNDNRNARSKLGEKVGRHASIGAAIGGLVGVLGGGVRGLAAGSVAGTAIGTASGAISHAIAARQHSKGQAEQTEAHAALSDKQHAQRVAAAKARWLKEGHEDYDAHFDKLHAGAAKSMLGRDAKVASIAQQRGNFWHGVADTQAAYDKVRKHLPKDANLMMEVHHAGGLLYNPEAVGEHHFDANGGTHKPLYMLHPAEADDFVAKHGQHGTPVHKRAPTGLITHRDQLVPANLEAAA